MIALRDRRYDAVIHLVTAADNAEAFYSLGNNTSRHEGLKFARELDKKVQTAWTGHPNFTIISNENRSFKQKINEVERTVRSHIGLPNPVSFYKKYLIQNPTASIVPILPEDQYAEKVIVDDTYLSSSEPNSIVKIRRRGN